MNSDLAEPELWSYRSAQAVPDDFDLFWADALATARTHSLDPRLVLVDCGLSTVDVYDVTFSGYQGEPIRAWLKVPHGATGALPTIIEYAGYGGGRGHAIERILWSTAGYAHLAMDTRGQGAGWGGGATEDPHGSGPSVPGFMTRGILNKDDYYYKRLFIDAARAIDLIKELPFCDAGRVAVVGGSQGGGIALAATALVPEVRGAFFRVPFLCDFPRSLAIAGTGPYTEVQTYLSNRRNDRDRAMDTLAYFDGANFATRGAVPGWFTAGLTDVVCPPSTVFGAFHNYRGAKNITLWPFNGHEGGGTEDDAQALHALHTLIGEGARRSSSDV